jgi:hypothetical protein
MIDVDEFLAQGIMAARAGDDQDAREKLRLARRIMPESTRIWLWLAAVADTPDDRRACLQRVLALSPGNLAAQFLLARMDTPETAADISRQVSLFECEACGGVKRFDPELACLVCTRCGKTQFLAAASAAGEAYDLYAALDHSETGYGNMLSGQAACTHCGAMILVPASQTTLTCSFCGTSSRLIQPTTPGTLLPHAVVPFGFRHESARRRLENWLSHQPGVSKKQARWLIAQPLSGIYLPFWILSGTVQVDCPPDSFVESPIDTILATTTIACSRLRATSLSPTERIVVRENAQSPFLYCFEQDVEGLPIYAGVKTSPNALMEIMPFDLSSQVRYSSDYLAGWSAECYQLALADAALEAHKLMRDQALQAAEKRRLIDNPLCLTSGDVRVKQFTYKLALLPVWIVAYTYRGEEFQLCLNGQTGVPGGQLAFGDAHSRPKDSRPSETTHGEAAPAPLPQDAPEHERERKISAVDTFTLLVFFLPALAIFIIFAGVLTYPPVFEFLFSRRPDIVETFLPCAPVVMGLMCAWLLALIRALRMMS